MQIIKDYRVWVFFSLFPLLPLPHLSQAIDAQREDIAYPRLEENFSDDKKPVFGRSTGLGLGSALGGNSGGNSGISLRWQGRLLHNICVEEISLDGVTVRHSEGKVKMPLNSVPSPITSHYKRQFQVILAAIRQNSSQ